MTVMLPNGKTVEVNDEERQECEIWTRVMGYYRPINAFNIGKKQEHKERVNFSESVIINRIDREEVANAR